MNFRLISVCRFDSTLVSDAVAYEIWKVVQTLNCCLNVIKTSSNVWKSNWNVNESFYYLLTNNLLAFLLRCFGTKLNIYGSKIGCFQTIWLTAVCRSRFFFNGTNSFLFPFFVKRERAVKIVMFRDVIDEFSRLEKNKKVHVFLTIFKDARCISTEQLPFQSSSNLHQCCLPFPCYFLHSPSNFFFFSFFLFRKIVWISFQMENNKNHN